MLFNSVDFLIFLPIVFTLYWLLPFRYRWMLLLASGYYFYMSRNKNFGLLLLGITAVNYYAALKISETSDQKIKKRWLFFSLISNLGCLFVFKYFSLFYNSALPFFNIGATTNHFTEQIIIPVGLSFYVFQSLSYTIDVYRGTVQAEKSLPRFALFVSFFPLLLAGPIERFSHLMPQFFEKRKLVMNNLITGVRIATWGFFKKMVIADRLACVVNPVFDDVHRYESLSLLIAVIFFAIQIYCDFSGYSDIALGTAKILGYDLMQNFKRPFFSTSITEFWRRWNTSLSNWFKDYVYIPFIINRRDWGKPGIALGLVITFFLIGLWHGASWLFVMYGCIHGLLLVYEMYTKKIRTIFLKKLPATAYNISGNLLMLCPVILLLVFVKAKNIEDLKFIYCSVFSFNYNFSIAVCELSGILKGMFPLLLSVFFVFFLFAKELNEEIGFINKVKGYDKILKLVFYALLFLTIFIFGKFNADGFIYFRF